MAYLSRWNHALLTELASYPTAKQACLSGKFSDRSDNSINYQFSNRGWNDPNNPRIIPLDQPPKVIPVQPIPDTVEEPLPEFITPLSLPEYSTAQRAEIEDLLTRLEQQPNLQVAIWGKARTLVGLQSTLSPSPVLLRPCPPIEALAVYAELSREIDSANVPGTISISFVLDIRNPLRKRIFTGK